MFCKLSAVSVFHRISLAGMFSVSSNRDASNSTFASGGTGDLIAGQWAVTTATGHRHGHCQAGPDSPVGVDEVLVLGQRVDLLDGRRDLPMDADDFLRQQTADLTVLLQDTFTRVHRGTRQYYRVLQRYLAVLQSRVG